MKTVEEMNVEYNVYIERHISNVRKCFAIYGEQLCERLGVDYDRLADMINDHDRSKYSEEEFEGYRVYFYPTEYENDEGNKQYRKNKFDSAWLHHLRNNAHHPEYWLYTDEDGVVRAKDMDPLHIAEMLLDWTAMSITKGDTTYAYWMGHGNTKPLSRNSIKLVQSCIDLFKDPVK